MSVRIALAGNPNCGKTTVFNALTGMNQYVGNWPGVTVEKKEGGLKNHDDVVVVDLPGVYSLSPYSPEEIVARNYLIDERPDVILNIIDGTNLERNLYLTTQLIELDIPVVLAVNMMDAVRKRGDVVNIEALAQKLGCRVAEMSAMTGEGVTAAVELALATAKGEKSGFMCRFSGSVEHALAHIEETALRGLPESRRRWLAVKLFERDGKIADKLSIDKDILNRLDADIRRCEDELDEDSESVITSERYAFIDSIIGDCLRLNDAEGLSASDKIDRIVTNRWLALPIFAAVMFLVYFVSVTTLGGIATDWANDGVFGEGWHFAGIGSSAYEDAVEKFQPAEGVENEASRFRPQVGHVEKFQPAEDAEKPDPAAFGIWIPGIPVVLSNVLKALNCAEWLQSLILDGIVAGVGAVLGFVPQMFILFFFLAFLEACGYMARVAFIMDRVFRKFGLSGKSFIPLLIGTGCGVPGVMASRTIESNRDRRITIMTTTFIPCSAKLPIIALLSGAIFDGAWWVAPSAYFVGIAAIISSGVILKKTRLFAGDVAPFVMELPAYHWPTAGAIMRSMWERGWSFIKKAGTLILLATIFVWSTSSFGWADGSFGMVEMPESILAKAGGAFAWIFAPLGWGDWQATVAAITGLIAKENVVGTFGILFGVAEVAEDGREIWGALAKHFTATAAYSFLVFNLLCAPCFAAMGAIKREMNSARWFWLAIGYQCGFAYCVALCVYQFSMLYLTESFGIGTAAAVVLLGAFLWMLFRPQKSGGDIPLRAALATSRA
ncbi:MAG: ferrous iron transporter B [Desulfovibrio sp.]|jgi:ferrous iron transport protein B|nr:ferrous iron transporter B [Desulfovibrio sp.]